MASVAAETEQAGTVRVLLANEPRAYRETLAAALAALRPEFEITTVRPEDLDATVADQAPDFVICSELTEMVETHAPAWVLLYPDGSRTCVMAVLGERSTMAEMELETLLTGLDRLSAT